MTADRQACLSLGFLYYQRSTETSYAGSFIFYRQVFLRLASLAILVATLYVQVTCSEQSTCMVGTGSCAAIQVL